MKVSIFFRSDPLIAGEDIPANSVVFFDPKVYWVYRQDAPGRVRAPGTTISAAKRMESVRLVQEFGFIV
jgi:hypothetical protein